MGLVWAVEWLAGSYVSAKCAHTRLGSLFGMFLTRLSAGAALVGGLALIEVIDTSLLTSGTWEGRIQSMGWLGVGAEELWADALPGLIFVISAVTATAIYLPNRKHFEWKRLSPSVVISVLIFSAINALIEEMTFRLIPLGFRGVPTDHAIWISAVAFGIPHYFGFPSRFAGVGLATFLGWFLAQLTTQSGGIGGAFLIHWAQDIVILSLLSASKHQTPFRILSDEPRPSLARAFALGLVVIAIFQFALAAGAPWGSAAWGGQFPGTLPANMRIASAFAIGIYVLFGMVFLARCKLLPAPISQLALRRWTTGIAAVLSLGVVLNLVSPSRPERLIMGPTALLLSLAANLLARSRSST